MITDDVWALVEQARAERPGAEADEVAAHLSTLLTQRPPAEIVAFEQPMWDLLAESYRADLWAAAYVINGGASDDGFDYFRGWLVLQGRAVFQQALADPDSLAGLPAVLAAQADGEDLWGEDLLSAASTAYRSVTGQEPPEDSFTIRYPELDPKWDFDFDDEDEMRRRLPRLCALYYAED